MNNLTLSEFFNKIPHQFYSSIKREILAKMHISNGTFYNWKKNRTRPTFCEMQELHKIMRQYEEYIL